MGIATFQTTAHGLPFICSDDAAIGRVVKKGEYELAEVRLLSLALRPGKTFVDAGANVGYFTILAAKMVGPTGRVYAFEPDLDNSSILQTNVTANSFTNTVICTHALGLRKEKRHLYKNTTNTGDHRTWSDNKELRPVELVDVRSLDDCLYGLDRLDILKVDVQGDEAGVLKGGQDLIKRSPGLVLSIEYWPYGLTANGSSPVEFFDFLFDHNFMVAVISPGNAALFPLDRNSALGVFSHNADEVCNLWCVKGA